MIAPVDRFVADARGALAREPWLVPLLITLVAVVIRLLYLGMPMRQDEAATVTEFAMQPWRLAWGKYTATNNHVLHTLFLKAGMELLGAAPRVVRLPAFLAGVLLVPVTYLVATRLYSRQAALVAAAGVAVMPSLVFFSGNARGYTMIVLAAMLQWLVLRHALRTNNPVSWGVFALVGAAGMFTHLTMAFAYGGNMLWALLWLVRNRELAASRLRSCVIAGAASVAVTVVLYAPVLYLSGARALMDNDNVRARSLAVFAESVPALLRRVGATWSTGVPGWMTAGWVAIATLGAVLGVASRQVERALPGAMLLFVAALLGLSLRVPPPRSFLLLLPLLLISYAGVWDRLVEGRGRVASLAGRVVALVPFLVMGYVHLADRPVLRMAETGWLPEGEGVAERLASVLRPGDVVASKWLAKDVVRYYLRAAGREAPFLPASRPTPPNDIYVLVVGGDPVASVLEYAGLPAALAGDARLVDEVGRVRLMAVAAPAP